MKIKDIIVFIPDLLDFLPASNPGVLGDLDPNFLEADIHDPVIQGATPMPLLHWACSKKQIPLIQKLIANKERIGLDINAEAYVYGTPLACIFHSWDQVQRPPNLTASRILIEAGADLSIPAGRDPMGPVLFLDRLMAEYDIQDLSNTGIRDILAIVYDRWLSGKSRLKPLTNNRNDIPDHIPLMIAAYAAEPESISVTLRNGPLYARKNFANICEKAYQDYCKDKFLENLYASLGDKGLAVLVEEVQAKVKKQQSEALDKALINAESASRDAPISSKPIVFSKLMTVSSPAPETPITVPVSFTEIQSLTEVKSIKELEEQQATQALVLGKTGATSIARKQEVPAVVGVGGSSSTPKEFELTFPNTKAWQDYREKLDKPTMPTTPSR